MIVSGLVILAVILLAPIGHELSVTAGLDDIVGVLAVCGVATVVGCCGLWALAASSRRPAKPASVPPEKVASDIGN